MCCARPSAALATSTTRRNLRCCRAIKPTIEHMKTESHLSRNLLACPQGNTSHLMRAAAGHPTPAPGLVPQPPCDPAQPHSHRVLPNVLLRGSASTRLKTRRFTSDYALAGSGVCATPSDASTCSKPLTEGRSPDTPTARHSSKSGQSIASAPDSSSMRSFARRKSVVSNPSMKRP